MQAPNSEETAPEPTKTSESPENSKASNSNSVVCEVSNSSGDDEPVLDVSGKNIDFSIVDNSSEAVRGLYLYKNVFNLIPKEVGTLRGLRTLKFFGNEINLFPSEIGTMAGLEKLQVKIASPSFGGLPLQLKSLKELELSKVPPRPSAFTILSEISGLNCLTKLSVCHFSIRYLPSEIGCLKTLEYLDLSFNKMKSLPNEISNLSALLSLKVANNKLVELPSSLSSLQRLRNLDLSNNRLTSMGSIELSLMHNLQNLNLQYNKFLAHCEIPSWICCNLEGIGGKPIDNFVNSSVEMDLYDNASHEYDGSLSRKGSHHLLPGLMTASASNNRCFSARKSGKRWKRRYYLQQRARQERLNNSRKWKGIDHTKLLSSVEDEKCEPGSLGVLAPDPSVEGTSEVILDDDDDDKEILPGDDESENLSNSGEDNDITLKKDLYAENDSCISVESSAVNKGDKYDSSEKNESLASVQNKVVEDEDTLSEMLKSYSNSKRHCDRDLDNPKPCKSRKSFDDSASVSRKYSDTSFCGIEDFLPDGFYDAGRDRPFMPVRNYEQSFPLDSREVIILDRERDEELDAIVISAQAMLSRLKQLNSLTRDAAWINELQVVSLLALFVSDHFGGSDKSAIIDKTRKAVSGSNYRKPFVCTCSTGNGMSVNTQTNPSAESVEDIVFSDICEKSLRAIKARRNSIIVPIGTVHFGVCRHRALLMKYLCDRMEPPILCELVRGYLDFMPHAWNIVLLKSGDSLVRMVVDACHPHDIREETDPEYYCRYIPLSRNRGSLSSGSSKTAQGSSFPSSFSDEILKAASTSLMRCKYGAVEAAAKVRTVEVSRTSANDIRNFEYGCLGEVRILGALQHSCIVEMYGHQISCKWISSEDGKSEYRVLQSTILMEYITGGSLKGYIEKLAKAGEKHVPVELALCIARDVASALVELHSKHIIHRDIKSENILIDLDRKKVDGTPIVKICDFDRAVPLRSLLHTCCIAQLGIPPPDVCVGTPRWMAPEVLRAMHERNPYGMEIDIWSFGCLLLEMLTLQIPYSGLPEVDIHDHLQMGKRPQLTDELEELDSSSEPDIGQSGSELDEKKADSVALKFLVDLFCQCTKENPKDRPTATELYEMLIAQPSNLTITERS